MKHLRDYLAKFNTTGTDGARTRHSPIYRGNKKPKVLVVVSGGVVVQVMADREVELAIIDEDNLKADGKSSDERDRIITEAYGKHPVEIL